MSGKVLIVTGHMASEGWQKISDLTLPTKEAYAEKWGCPLVVNVVGKDAWDRLLSNPDGSKRWGHTGFARTRSCQVEMERMLYTPDGDGVTHLIYIDCDAAVVGMDVDIVAYLESFGPEKWFYAADDWNSLQSGIFGFRVCGDSLKLLERVWGAESRFSDNYWQEQGAMELYGASGRAVLEKKLFNAYPRHDAWRGGDYEKGYSWAVHAPAVSDEERGHHLGRIIRGED